MSQLDLDGFEVDFSCSYKCKSCLKFFQTMKESAKHQAKHVKHRRKKQSINYVLENFGLLSIKTNENRNILNVGELR